jgi:hypothetical protein
MAGLKMERGGLTMKSRQTLTRARQRRDKWAGLDRGSAGPEANHAPISIQLRGAQRYRTAFDRWRSQTAPLDGSAVSRVAASFEVAFAAAGVDAGSTGMRHGLHGICLPGTRQNAAGFNPQCYCWRSDPGSGGKLPRLRYYRPAYRITPPSSRRCGSYSLFSRHPVSACRRRVRHCRPAPARDRRHAGCRSSHPGARCS